MIHPLGHHHIHHMTRLNEVGKLYWAHSIRGIAMAMVGVLVPIFLYTIGYSIPDILIFGVIQGVAWGVFVYPAMWMIHRWGGNKTMAVATVVSLGYFATLATLPDHRLLWVPAVAWGMMVAPYWYALRAAFASAIDVDRPGNQVGRSAALYLAAIGAAPALGGIIGTAFGISFTYLVAVILCIIALVPLLRGEDPIPSRRPDLRKQLQLPRYWRDYTANICSTVDDAIQGFAWPLLVFFVLPSYAGVGVASSIITVATILISLYVGSAEQKRGAKHYLKQGSYLLAATSAARLLISNALHVFGINFFYGISRALVDTPYMTKYYQNARRGPTLEYVFGMQMASVVGYTLTLLLMLAATLIVSDETALILGLALMVPASLGVRLIR